MSTRPPCPLCGDNAGTDEGVVPHIPPFKVAGVPIDLGGVEFRIVRCATCALRYKVPPIPPARLMDCYERVASDYYGFDVDPRRRRYDELAAIITRHAPGRRILDIGCFNGAWLSYLGERWQRFGVEPCRPAASVAEDRGVRVIAPVLEEVPIHERFDVITAIDVLEHIPAPLPFLRRAVDLLAPGGMIVIVTGDSDATLWRWQGPLYWYVNIPEHVVFFSEPTMRWVERTLNLERVLYDRRCHSREPMLDAAKQTAKNLAYMAAQWLGYRFDRGAPGWMAARDHLFYAARKGPGSD